MKCSGTGKTQVSVVKNKLNYAAHKCKVLDGDTKYKEK
jgi:adenylylsulfate kinase-like enzyme